MLTAVNLQQREMLPERRQRRGGIGKKRRMIIRYGVFKENGQHESKSMNHRCGFGVFAEIEKGLLDIFRGIITAGLAEAAGFCFAFFVGTTVL